MLLVLQSYKVIEPAATSAVNMQGLSHTLPANRFHRKLAQGTSASVPAYVDWVAQGKVTPPQPEGSQVRWGPVQASLYRE